MKPLILILLAAISAQAQTLAEAARMERLRRAQLVSSRVYTTADVNGIATAAAPTTAPIADPNVVEKTAAPAVAQPATPAIAPSVTPAAATAVTPAAATPVDAALKYLEYSAELQKIRNRVQQLQDQETALQLQQTDWNNRFLAPITDQASRAEAQTRIADTQKQLDSVRRELADTRAKLLQMEVLAPAK